MATIHRITGAEITTPRAARFRDLDAVRAGLSTLPPADEAARAKAVGRETTLTKPAGALGRLEELAAWLAAWQGRHPPSIDNVRAIVFAANHGIASRGVSAYPAAVTAQMVANFERGGAAVNQLCEVVGANLSVIAIDLERATKDFLDAPAMSEEEFVAAIAVGHAAIDRSADLLCLGEMGIGNTTAAAAICNVLFGGRAETWTGPGTGVDGAARARKSAVVERAVARHINAVADGLDALRRLGGRELGAIAGAVLAARESRIPVVLDGFVSTAAAAALEACLPGALDHCVVGHVSAEPGHRLLVDRLRKTPLLALDMRLGEASGAVLAVPVLRGACACHAGMATFGEAAVAEKSI